MRHTKAEAEAIGAEMLRDLGKGWSLYVHENLGWHVTAKRGSISVSPSFYREGKPTYFALMSSEKNVANSGAMVWHTDHPNFETPSDAVIYQVQQARKVIDNLTEILEQGETFCKEFRCECCGKSKV